MLKGRTYLFAREDRREANTTSMNQCLEERVEDAVLYNTQKYVPDFQWRFMEGDFSFPTMSWIA